MNQQEFERLISDVEAAAMLNLTDKDGRPNPRAVQHLARLGRLPAKKVGRYWRFRRSWLERWLEGEDAKSISGGPALAPQGKAH